MKMRSIVWGALLTSALISLTGCFNRLNTSEIEQELETEIESQSYRLSLAEVRCPRSVYRQSGAYFRCVGYLRPEGEFTINVTQQDGQGHIAWDVPSSHVILNMAKVENKLQQDFAQAFSKRAALNCGAMYRLNQPGEQFECAVVGNVNLGQEQITALVVRVDPEGNLNWYEVRETIAPVVNASTPSSSPQSTFTTPATDRSQAANTSTEKRAGTRNVERPRVPGDDD